LSSFDQPPKKSFEVVAVAVWETDLICWLFSFQKRGGGGAVSDSERWEGKEGEEEVEEAEPDAWEEKDAFVGENLAW